MWNDVTVKYINDDFPSCKSWWKIAKRRVNCCFHYSLAESEKQSRYIYSWSGRKSDRKRYRRRSYYFWNGFLWCLRMWQQLLTFLALCVSMRRSYSTYQSSFFILINFPFLSLIYNMYFISTCRGILDYNCERSDLQLLFYLLNRFEGL